ncbi:MULTISPECIES: MFS transporter [Pseudomonas]|uniref:MFS transporter n=1 Tax=Pseudomonas shahriarae TaxID=2745512 RepID=A0ABT5N844_9PSED|nr:MULTISPECIES: MFS transporter [Pseudomonas]MDD0984718.1 MFS transporter [Pseudomonas shahriarae]MDD1032891.1 MFS transporter [Pseudomonas shahriarae]NMY83155.1 MFS transporter [Pseudomonas sp. WS 5411]
MSSFTDSRRPLVVALLMTVVIISVLDKTIFAFAGPQIIDELKLTPAQFGFISSAFFFLYSISGVLVGFLANRMPSRWILSGMALVWMTAQLLAALSTSFFTLLASRILLGAGCGPGTAVTQHACFKWYTSRERVLPAALIQVAIMLGAIAGAVALPKLIEQYGWRTGYVLLAGVGLVWLLLWQRYGREGQHDDTRDTQGDLLPTLPYKRLLLNRTFVCITLVAFCSYLPNALLYSWLPTYLQRGLGMTPMQSGYLVLTTTLGVIFINLLVSSLAQRAMKRGASLRKAMVVPPLLACLVAAVTYILMGFTSTSLTVTLGFFLLGSILLNLLSAFGFSIVAHIAPARQRGSMLAIHIALLTTAGMLAPVLVGQAIGWQNGDLVTGFELAIGLFGIALLVFSLLGLVLIDPERSRRELLASTPSAAFEATSPA